MNTPPAEDMEEMDPCGPSPKTKQLHLALEDEHAASIVASWTRLLEQLREEIRTVTEASTSQNTLTIPEITFQDLRSGLVFVFLFFFLKKNNTPAPVHQTTYMLSY